MQKPEIIYQDENLIVVNKPAGMPVHEAKHSTDYSLCDWLLERFPEIKDVGDFPARAFREDGAAYGEPYRPGIVHRLDKQTSGVMIVARNQESFLKLKETFKSRRVEKVYTALICGRPKEKSGIISKPIGRLISSPMKMGIAADLGEPLASSPSRSGRQGQAGRDRGRGGVRLIKEAVTEYKTLKEFSDTTLIEAKPKTGRMHQIRLHLASIGHPIAGDIIYGGSNVCHADLHRYFLHASSISFSWGAIGRLQFEADLPLHLIDLLQHLEKNDVGNQT